MTETSADDASKGRKPVGKSKDKPGKGDAGATQPQRFSIRTVLPNMVTLLAFATGFTAINYAYREMWFFGVVAILLAGVLDGLDGAVARLLRSTSRFGAELDSLSDTVAFGVAPALLVYLWSLQGLGRLGWVVATLYAVAMALRLARFNSRMDMDTDLRKRHGYLTGVPAPAGAGLAITPILVDDLLVQTTLQELPQLIAFYEAAIACLMISTLPTISLKNIHIPRAFLTPLMLVFAAILGGLFIHPALVLTIIAIGYLISIPLCYLGFRRKRARETV